MVIELRRGQFEIELKGKAIGTIAPWSGRDGRVLRQARLGDRAHAAMIGGLD
jgi:hypothetical protein